MFATKRSHHQSVVQGCAIAFDDLITNAKAACQPIELQGKILLNTGTSLDLTIGKSPHPAQTCHFLRPPRTMTTHFDPARHIVCLGYALEAMISCALSFLEPRSTMIGHGFPKRIANDSATWPVYKLAETHS